MTEIIFWVEDDPEGGYVARALGETSTHQSASTTPSQTLPA
jgi:hypothetical protein